MSLLRIPILFACCLLTASAMGQRHYFVPYSVKQGLAQSQVLDIEQTSDGYLWVATMGGISRFDGVTFTTYNKSNGLIDNRVNTFYEANDGTLIVACNGGLVKFRDNNIEQSPFPAQFKDIVARDMLEYKGNLVVATNGNGLMIYRNDRIESVNLGSQDLNFVRSLELSRDKTIMLVGTKGGLLQFDNGRFKTLLDSVSVSKIIRDQDRFWITTHDDGAFLLENNEITQFTAEDGLQSMHQRYVCVDEYRNPWFISKSSIIRYNTATGEFERIKSIDPAHTTDLRIIYTDKESNIWIGTSGEGILKYTGDAFNAYTTADHLASDIVTCIRQQPDGVLWLASYGWGLMRMEAKNIEEVDHWDGLLNNTIWSVLVLGNEHLWVGTAEGISIYDNGNIRNFPLNDSLPFRTVSTLFRDSKNQVWIGTRDGLMVVKDMKVRTPAALRRLDIRETRSFLQIDNTIWISSRSGLYGYNLITGAVEHIGKSHGLMENYISCMASDSRKNLWLGTDEGIHCYNVITKKVSSIAVSKAVSSNIVNFLLNENDNELWIGTDNGLFSIDLNLFHKTDSIDIRSYNEHDGVVSQECNQNAAFQDAQGNLWFGTNGSLLKFNPAARREEDKDISIIHLLDVQLNFESILDRVDLNAAQASENELTYKENRLTFRFSAVYYSNPEKVLYSYRLVGSDEDWSPPVRENYVTYANLPHGEYEFQVRARVENFPWNEEYAAFRFRILPPFWLEWWFILLCVMATFATGYAIYYQVNKEQQRKRHLEEVQNKAKILGLEQQTLNAHMNRHFIFNALNSIQYYINTQDRKSANTYLSNFAALVRKNLDSAQVESIYLKDELDRLKLYMNLEQMRFKDRFEYTIIVDEALDIESLLVPSMILQPFVENSIMHGILPSEKKGIIEIRISERNDDIVFEISDNGIGIETSVKQKNGTSFHVSNGMKITKQRMQLLGKMTRRNYDVQGPVELKNGDEKPCGTLVTIVLPQQYRTIEDIL